MLIVIGIVLFCVIGAAAVFVDLSRAEAARLRLLVELSERLQLSLTIDDAVSVLPTFAMRLFPHLEGSLFIARPGGTGVRLAASWSNACEEDAIEMHACNALMHGATYVSSHGGEPICEHSVINAEASTICVPMLDAGEPFGLLMLRAPDGNLPPGVRRLANPLAHQVGLALSNLRLQETLRAAAVRDSLTGLYNRRCITESVTMELLNPGNPNARVGVILLDVDHFKRFNDTWGHGGGDMLLRALSGLMQDVFSGRDDIVCRYGGEEFVVVLPNVTPTLLRARADRLLERVRDLQVQCDGHLIGGITVSAGLAISPNHGIHIEGLIAAADRALYVAKSAGRDRVCAPPPQLVEQSHAA
jgi:diguanylate cyclase (GGDEF)-like protein